ncbi:major capsid family protein [Klebsiella aerogenes]|nr:major capsid family protein [Klebsiella aerogenes]KKY64149.1 hypothetical protein OA41_20405 [Klebsiella aerogenes]
MNVDEIKPVMQAYCAGTLRANGHEVNVDEQGIIFAEDVVAVSKKIYEKKMPAPQALSLFPQEPDITDADEWFEYRMYDAQGMAKIMAAYGTDMPMMTVKGEAFIAKMYTVGLGFGWTYKEMLQSAKKGIPLKQIEGTQCRKIHERTISNILWKGDAEYNIVGFSEHPNIPEVAVAGGWASADGDAIADDVSAIISAVNGTDVFDVNKFQMPGKAWTIVQGKRMPDTGDTVLSFLKKAYPEITFSKNSDLNESGACMAIDMNEENFSQGTPVLFRQLAPQPKGIDIAVPCISMTCGTIVRQPLAASKSTKVV